MLSLENIVKEISKGSGISEGDVKKKIEEKQIELSGLVSPEGAAYIVGKELGVNLLKKTAKRRLKIKNILPGMRSIDVTGKILGISDKRDFEKSGKSGSVVNLMLADETGVVRVSLWNDEIGLLEKLGRTVDDFDHFVFHQPNTKFPLTAAKALGIPKEKLMRGLLVPQIGNTYSASTLIGLASVLDIAEPGEKILATSFGSGAGSDSFSFTITKLIKKKRRKENSVEGMIKNRKYVDYAEYIKFRRKIKGVNL